MTQAGRKAQRRAIDHFAERGNEALRRYDPLGLIEAGAPDDEYDCVVTGALVELIHERFDTLADWMSAHMEQLFGVTPDASVHAAAGDLIELWRSKELAPLRG